MVSFQCLKAGGNVLVAAQGQCIHTFSLDDGSHLTTWKHPDCENPYEASWPGKQGDRNGDEAPGAKRRKLNGGVEQLVVPEDTQPSRTGEDSIRENDTSKTQKQKKLESKPKHQELLLVTDIAATADFRHVVAVTGQDKTIRVFEHDGAGKLRLLSERYVLSDQC